MPIDSVILIIWPNLGQAIQICVLFILFESLSFGGADYIYSTYMQYINFFFEHLVGRITDECILFNIIVICKEVYLKRKLNCYV